MTVYVATRKDVEETSINPMEWLCPFCQAWNEYETLEGAKCVGPECGAYLALIFGDEDDNGPLKIQACNTGDKASGRIR